MPAASRLDPPRLADDDTPAMRPLVEDDAGHRFADVALLDLVRPTRWNADGVDALRRIVADGAPDATSGPCRYAVADGSGARVGTTGFPMVSSATRTAEVAWDFACSAWGRGVATRCCRAVTERALHDLGFVRLQATTLDTNVAPRRVVEACGFAWEGMLTTLTIVRGEPRDVHRFARTP